MPALDPPFSPDLNKPALRRLIDHLKLPETGEHFDMSTWFSGPGVYSLSPPTLGKLLHTCGSALCIAGHQVALANPTRSARPGDDAGIMRLAADGLGLTEEAANALFLGHNDYNILLEHLTLSEAIATLELLEETGFVEWQIDDMLSLEDRGIEDERDF